jgi:trimeric autotransporter adhesin
MPSKNQINNELDFIPTLGTQQMVTIRLPSCKIAILLWVVLLATGTLYAQFGGGTGTIQDPYVVQNATHLNNIRNYRSCHFLQTTPINLNVAPYNQGQGWNPICLAYTPFTGSYDGGGFVISGLYINQNYSYAGLFGYTSGAELTRIKLENAVITSTNNWVGALLGKGINTTISACQASATINAEMDVGGLAGELVDSSVSDCQTNVIISAQAQVGGLIGWATNCTISSCASMGSSQGSVATAGLVAHSNYCTYLDCYAKMTLIAVNSGGLISDMTGGFLTNSYAVSSFQTDSESGGLIQSASNVTISHSYWNTQTSGVTYSAGGEGRNTDQMTYPYDDNTYVGWGFPDPWLADSTGTMNDGYPYLAVGTGFGVVSAPSFSHASGYYDSPFQLVLYCATPNATIHYTLDGSEPTAQSPLYTAPIPINTMTTVKAFACRTGWINSVTVTAQYYLGWFGGGAGTTEDPYRISTPQHLHGMRLAPDACFVQVQDIDMDVPPFNSGSGWDPIGYTSPTDYDEFTGYFYGNGYEIANLFVQTGNYAGLFGLTDGAELREINLTNLNVWGESWVGGLVGYSIDTDIIKCSVSGDIHGTSTVGGLVGFPVSSDISNCFSTASVSSHNRVGGLVGTMYMHSTVENCFSAGLVTCSGSYAGGLIGELDYGEHTITASYWDMQASGQSSSAAGSGRTSDEMTYPYAANTYQGWNFSYIWKADDTYYNGGYPYLLRRVECPVISVTPAPPLEPVLCSMSCSTWGAQIFYTLDDSEPTESSLLYSEPFWIYSDADSTVDVRARAYKTGYVPSMIATAHWYFGFVANPPEENTPQLQDIECYPNPFTACCRIKANLSRPGRASLRIYNSRGQLVRILHSDTWTAKEIEGAWNGRDSNGREVAAGIYLLCLEGSETRIMRKIIKFQ